jgi:hypothetical protein
LIPWKQSQDTYEALVEKGIEAGMALIKDAPYIYDLNSSLESEEWKAAL